MHKLVTLCTLALLWTAQATGQTRFVIDRDDVKSGATEISKSADKLIEKLTSRWRRANRNLTKEEQDKILSGAKALVANRYLATPTPEDSTLIRLYLAKRPTGLVILANGSTALGLAYVNEAGGTELHTLNGKDEGLDKTFAMMEEGETYIVSGIGQPDKLFSNKDGQEFATDIYTGETAAFDTSALPDYVFTGTQTHRAATTVWSIIGGTVTIGLIAIMAIL